MRRCPRRVPALRSGFVGFRFPPEVILVAVRWYLRYGLSYRDVEELLAERGVVVDHVTVYRWVQRFTPLLIDAARPCRHAPGDRWFVDETYVKVAGRWVYLYRAIDQFKQVIDVLVSEKRDLAATRRFFTHALQHGTHPTEVMTRIRRKPAVRHILAGQRSVGRESLLWHCDPAHSHAEWRLTRDQDKPSAAPASTQMMAGFRRIWALPVVEPLGCGSARRLWTSAAGTDPQLSTASPGRRSALLRPGRVGAAHCCAAPP